ncbi:fasciclin domain-containing protein [Glaciecola petra]|uniref:Fasciclin domain-containing protein n=1 Tax=Glaciecola petra TaxID=3075602 RepID=A0ABU2ZSB2_9ALTE|nr:fasciclin domain-containing protein [Aestuariibacter sp. P117]MDT0595310.1 fasciclin domain-containing protein [Aestuariibacter sp. P117]
MKFSMKIIAIAFSLIVLQGCGSDNDDEVEVQEPPVTESNDTIVGIAQSNAGFSTLVAVLEATGLDVTLSDTSQTFTVFAPTDEAFAALGGNTLTALLNDTDTLSSILTYHVLPGAVDADAAIAAAGSAVTTVNGADIAISLVGDSLLINGVSVTFTNIQASNGIIHAIDAVLTVPAERGDPTANIVETAVAAGNFTTLASLLTSAGLVDTLSNPDAEFTVFAPTDAAFEMLGDDVLTSLGENPEVLEAILLQHVVPDATIDSITAYTLAGMNAATASGAEIPVGINTNNDRITFGGANVTTPDVYASNGVIHVIDMVVVADVDVPPAGENIVEVASQNDSFTTLVAALQATGLDETLADESGTQFTVFAPSDAAFALLGQDTIDALLNDTDTLSDILLYHVVSGSAVLQDAAVTLAQSDDNLVEMANMQDAALSFTDSTLFVNASAVSSTDVVANNGVIHVIDQVILPPSMRGEPTLNIAETALADDNFSTLVAALQAADLVDTLANEEATFTVFAPTNAAFDKIEDTALDGLLLDTDALSTVLLQHVVAGEVTAVQAYAANGGSVDTVAENDVTVNLVNFTKSVNDENAEVAYDAENEMLVGGMGSSNPGFTVYVFNNDLGSAGSNCNDGCAANWPPVLVTDDMVSGVPGLSTIERGDGAMQAAYQGRPLYFFANDTAIGDANGDGVGDVWFKVNQAQVSLQIQGSNVTTTDIYTTNGVIHVIDTVITETLEAATLQ